MAISQETKARSMAIGAAIAFVAIVIVRAMLPRLVGTILLLVGAALWIAVAYWQYRRSEARAIP